MKANIHPTYYNDTKVTCSCGNTFTTGSIRQSISVEVCSNCHPFYTGEERLLDTRGRAENFARKMKAAEKYTAKKSKKHRNKSQDGNQPKTLRELLGEI